MWLVDRLKQAIDKAEKEEQMALDLLQKSLGRLQRARKQRDLLRRRGSLMLQRKAKTVEDLEELECLEAEAEGSEGSHSKRPRHGGSDANPSSSNTQAVASNSVISVSSPNASGGADLSVDLSRLPFWDSSLADLFSSEVVDPLASGDLGSGGGTL